MKQLYLSFVFPDTWRSNIKVEITKSQWRKLRLKILKRDDCTCQYCNYKAEKGQIVHHINGDPNDNKESNLETICLMCSTIFHAGRSCNILRVVDIYKESKYSQREIIQITRKMREEKKKDKEIIDYLGLKGKIPFKMDKAYLKRSFGFITSRKPRTGI